MHAAAGNRRDRLASILTLLSSGYKLSTPELAVQFGVSKRVIQLDLKEYLIPLFDDGTVFYDYSSKCYAAKKNFLTGTLFSSEELALMAILKMKSRDKYSDDDLAEKTAAFFQKFEDALSDSFYQQTLTEKIDDFKSEIIQLRHAIEQKRAVTCDYNGQFRELLPLKILNLEGFWYLINYDTFYDEVRRYHLNSISDVELLDEEFEFDDDILERFDNAINAFFEPHIDPFPVELFLDAKIARYFLRKPVSKTQRVIKTYDDGSCEIEVYITDFMEIIPTIQRFLPHVLVVSPDELGELIYRNVESYIKIR